MKNKKTLIPVLVIIVLAAAAIAAAVILNSEKGYRVIKVFELNGSASVARENTGELDAYEGMNLESGDVLSVEKKSTMSLSLDSDKYIFLDGGTVLALTAQGSAGDSRTVIDLREGKIRNEIKEPLSENSSYEVHTPRVTIAVRGTVFDVTAVKNSDGSYVTDVYTAEGTVSVQFYGENGEPVGDETYVTAGGTVTVLTEASGDPHFVYRNGDGSLVDCKDSDPVYYPGSGSSDETTGTIAGGDEPVEAAMKTVSADEEFIDYIMGDVNIFENDAEAMFEQLIEDGVLGEEVYMLGWSAEAVSDGMHPAKDGLVEIYHIEGTLDISLPFTDILNQKEPQEQTEILNAVANAYKDAFNVDIVKITCSGESIITDEISYDEIVAEEIEKLIRDMEADEAYKEE